MEAWTGIEPVIKVLQTSALPLGYHAELFVRRGDPTPERATPQRSKYGVKTWF
jgi:hypothetical protein